MFKGIFWYVPDDKRLITVKVACNENGNALQPVDCSSKSGEKFNHQAEWGKLHKSVTEGNSYNYYPRGKVEIKNSKATIFLHPALNRFDIHERIERDFRLVGPPYMYISWRTVRSIMRIRWVSSRQNVICAVKSLIATIIITISALISVWDMDQPTIWSGCS